MKRFIATLATVLLSGVAAFAQVPGPQIPLTGSIGVPGSSAVLGYFPVSFTSDANHTLTPTEWANHVLLVTSTVSLTATRNLIAPNNFGQDMIVQNKTTGGQSIQVISSSGTGVTIPNGQSAEVFFDGTNYAANSSGAGISGSGTTGIVPIWTGSTALGDSPIDLGVTLANNLTIQPPNNDSIQVLSTGTGTTTITAGSGVDINASTGNVRLESVASGGTVQVVTDGNAQNMSFPSPGFTGTVGVLEGPTTATHYIEVAADGVGLQDGGSALSTVATTGNINDTIGVTTPGRIPVNVANGVNFWGNSECADVGANPASLGWASRFVSTYMVGVVNAVTTRRCITGGFSADAINFGALLRQTSQVSLVPFNMPSYGAPLTFVQSLENDANNNTGLNTALQMASKEQDFALIALGTAPLDQQIQATNAGWTCTGTQAGDDYYGSILPGTILTAGQTCSTSITTIADPNTTTSEPIDMLYTIFGGDTGTGQVMIDGNLATDTITGVSTLANAPFGGAALLTGTCCSFTRTLALARFIPTSVGTHTVSIAGVATGTNGFGFQSIFTTPVGIPSYAAPTVIKLGVLRQQGDANATATASYDTMSETDCNLMWADGFRCIFAPNRSPFITPSNLSFMMSSTNASTAGAITRTNMTFTSGSASVSSATNFNSSYVNKLVICTDGLTSSTDYSGTVSSWTSASPTLLNLSSNIGNSSGAGTGVCRFGTNSQLTLASSSPGLHPANAGHDAELQGVLSRVQPTQLPPIPAGFTNFTSGMATNVAQSSGIFNMNYANNTPATLLTSAPYCGVLFGAQSNAITGVNVAATCFGRDTVKSQFFTGIVSQFNMQTKIGDNNVNTYQNGSFRWDFVFDNSAGGVNGITDRGIFFNNGLDSYTTDTLASQATLNAPGAKFVNVTGTAAISAINLPPGSASLGAASGSPAVTTYEGCINFTASGGTVGTNAWSVTAGSTILTGFQAVFGQQYQGCYDGTNWRFTGPGIGSLSGMTASQVPIAATTTTVTSSKAIAGSGAGLTSGPTTATATDVPVFTSTTGGLVDSGVLLSSLCQTSGTNCPASSSYSLGGTLSGSNITAGAGAGTSPTVAISGLDGSHNVTLTTGTLPLGTSALFTVTFTTPRPHNAFCVVTPQNQLSAAVSVTDLWVTNNAATSYTWNIGATGLIAATTYSWNISCP